MSAETGQPRSAAVSGPVRLGLRENWTQFALLVVVNVFVGGMVGLERTTTSLVFSEGADMLNEVAGIPDVTFGLHLCRGNYDSDWISSGTYETISKQLFRRAANYDVLLANRRLTGRCHCPGVSCQACQVVGRWSHPGSDQSVSENAPPRRFPSMRGVPITTRRGGNLP